VLDNHKRSRGTLKSLEVKTNRCEGEGMNFFRLFDRQVKYIITAGVLVFATVASVLVPAIVSAAQLTERSIALSSSSVSSTNVTYEVNFTSVGAAGAFIIDFCSDSSIINQTCTTPTDFDVTAVSSTTSGFTDVADLDANTIRVTGTIAATTAITVELDGIDNPSVDGPMYARILTYTDATGANAYTSTVAGTYIDDGGAAVSITDTIGVSGSVLESMTFCVSGEAIAEDCDTSGNDPATIQLGETVGSTVALTPDSVSTGSIFTQISTNADSGAVVSLKSSALACGGLIRAGSPAECDIAPALATDIAAGEAKFGVKTTTATATPSSDATGTYQPVSGSDYNNTTFAFTYVSGDATGVTSPFGDPFLDTATAPVNNMNMELSFGVSITNSTPAGLYSVDLSLIATGKF